MSYDYCQNWNEKEKKCGKGLRKCYLSHLDKNGNCDGWYFYEKEFELDSVGGENEKEN